MLSGFVPLSARAVEVCGPIVFVHTTRFLKRRVVPTALESVWNRIGPHQLGGGAVGLLSNKLLGSISCLLTDGAVYWACFLIIDVS